jgi:hypothetical protein
MAIKKNNEELNTKIDELVGTLLYARKHTDEQIVDKVLSTFGEAAEDYATIKLVAGTRKWLNKNPADEYVVSHKFVGLDKNPLEEIEAKGDKKEPKAKDTSSPAISESGAGINARLVAVINAEIERLIKMRDAINQF